MENKPDYLVRQAVVLGHYFYKDLRDNSIRVYKYDKMLFGQGKNIIDCIIKLVDTSVPTPTVFEHFLRRFFGEDL